MDYFLQPHFTYPAALIAIAVATFFLGMFARGAVTKTRIRNVIPVELTRLAANLRITEDLPVSESIGRRIHDLFEERDMEIMTLSADLSDERINADSWQKQAEAYQAKYEAKMEQLTDWAAADDPRAPLPVIDAEWAPAGPTLEDLEVYTGKGHQVQRLGESKGLTRGYYVVKAA